MLKKSEKPSLSLDLGKDSVLITISAEGQSHTIELDLPQVYNVFRGLGSCMNMVLNNKVGHLENPAKTPHRISVEANALAVTGTSDKTFLNIRFPDFPTLQIQIPNEAVHQTGKALVEAAPVFKPEMQVRVN